MENVRTKLFFRYALRISLFIFFSSGLLHTNTSAQIKVKNLETKLDGIIDSFYVTDKLPGVIVGIWTPDFTYKKAFGKADIKTGEERKFDDKIRIGSITKTFVATVILQLADEAKLNIDDKLSKYYPSYPNSENITLRQILNMTSGIPDYIEDPMVLKSFIYNRTNKFTPMELMDATIALPPFFAPGKGWQYSNGNYNILGMLIEKITENKIEDEINKRIILPLGLTNTSYPVSPYIDGQYSHGYFADTVSGELMDYTVMDPSITWAAGCMISNIPDLKIYAEALVTGTLLSKNTQNERLKFVNTGIKDFLKYGLGIFSMSGFIGHNGGITGYNTTMCYNPELNSMIIVSVNEYGVTGGKSDNIFAKLAMTIYPEMNLFE